MADATVRFFEDLERREYEPLLAKTSGTLRIELNEGSQTRHWLLRINRGGVQVRQEDMEADAVVYTSRDVFEELVTGREHGLAALLRGDVTLTGDARLVMRLERLLPGAPDARGPLYYRKEAR